MCSDLQIPDRRLISLNLDEFRDCLFPLTFPLSRRTHVIYLAALSALISGEPFISPIVLPPAKAIRPVPYLTIDI